MKPPHLLTYNKYAVIFLRIIIGALFVYAGFVKAVDPWGFLFKIGDYLTAWNLTVPRSIILVGAVGISAFEFVFGLLLFTGSFKRWAPLMLTLSMVVMLPLTFYVWIENPVSDCGCFGDAFKISNAATFWKNVIVTATLIYLIKNNTKYNKGIFKPASQWIVCSIGILYIIAISLYGYNIQPVIDFRPYPVGTDLYTALSDETDDTDNAIEINFIYEKNGIRQTFDLDNLPDSTWTFVERVDNVHSLDSESEKGLTVFDIDGYETDPADIISNQGDQLILVLPEPNRTDIAYTYAINEFYTAMKNNNGSMIALIASGEQGIEKWKDLSMAEYECYSADDTRLKQLVRGTPAFVYLRDGIIVWKRTVSSIEFNIIRQIGRGEILPVDAVDADFKPLTILTSGAVVILLLTLGLQSLIVAVRSKRKKIESKSDTL